MAEPLHLPEDQGPQTEQIRLGGSTLELDPAAAAVIRQEFESLAAQYGAALEDYRRQALQSVGTPQPMPQWQPPPMPEVPDPDLLFQNKQAWTDEFARNLEMRIGQAEGRSAQMAQGLASAFQQELNRRDLAQQAQARHDAAMQEMLDRRGLTENTRVVQAIYNEQYEKLKNLPLELALDQIGAEAEAEIERIRSGETWSIGAAPTQTGVAPRPPAMLRTTRRASRPAAPPAAPSDTGLAAPGGGLGAMGMIIRKRQAQVMGGTAA